MIKFLKILLTGFIVSSFLFPVTYDFLPFSNTKNILGAVGLVCVGIMLIRKKEFILPRRLLLLLLLAGIVSIAALFSITYNQTPDSSYVSYIISAIIWLCGAYAVCSFIYLTHKRIDLSLVANYLIWVCVFQCAMALLIDFVPSVRLFVDAHVAQGQAMLQKLDRLYGIGASLDVGGSRFAAVLVLTAYLIVQKKDEREGVPLTLLILAFITITVVGNMIARTTLVGVIVGLLYIILMELRNLSLRKTSEKRHSSLGAWAGMLIIFVPLCSILYNFSPQFHELMRFGFEGFFSLFEEGTWTTDSGAKLERMIVWPEELRTWIIGDGYFENQRNDANYIGDATVRGFYMGTDIGYLRFIFYFGLIGLIAISAVMIYAGIIAIKEMPRHSHAFMMVVLCNFIVWFKVSTDLFPVLSICAAIAFLKDDIQFLKEKEKEEAEEEAETLVPE